MDGNIILPETSGIYLIVNIENGKLYVGKSINMYRRQKEHISMLKRGIHHCIPLQNSWNKHSDERFTFAVLCFGDEDKLNDIEQSILDCNWDILYNTNPTSFSYFESMTLEQIKRRAENQHRPVKMFDINTGNLIKQFSSLKHAANFLEVKQTVAIGNVCRGQKITYQGYTFRFADEYPSDTLSLKEIQEITKKRRIPKRPVIQINSENIIIQGFESAAMAEKITGICSSAIHKVCKEKAQTAGSYKWRYNDDT